MQKGQIEYAKRKALNRFDEWNDVTGVFPKFTGYYYEIQGVIEDAVDIGIKVALGLDPDTFEEDEEDADESRSL